MDVLCGGGLFRSYGAKVLGVGIYYCYVAQWGYDRVLVVLI